MHPFFHEVRKRPEFYLGDPGLPFTKLMAFIDGYVIGYEMGRHATAEWPRDFIPQDFDAYVRQHFRCEDDTRSWKRRIREHASSEEDAFRIFFELLDGYEADQP